MRKIKLTKNNADKVFEAMAKPEPPNAKLRSAAKQYKKRYGIGH